MVNIRLVETELILGEEEINWARKVTSQDRMDS